MGVTVVVPAAVDAQSLGTEAAHVDTVTIRAETGRTNVNVRE